jgi:hypothetical protein
MAYEMHLYRSHHSFFAKPSPYVNVICLIMIHHFIKPSCIHHNHGAQVLPKTAIMQQIKQFLHMSFET